MGQISITALAPVIRQSVDTFQERLQPESETYTISASYGYDSCQFVIRGDMDYLRGWFRAGLVRDVIWRSPNGRIIWNGYVQSLQLKEGGLSRSKSIAQMANRIYYVYSSLDTSTNPPTVGEQKTITVNDTTSQATYGIKTATISGGQISDTAASVEANTILTEMSRIRIDEQMVFGQGSPPSLSVRCAGYAHMMDWWNYSQVVSSGTANISTVIAAVLAADPNSVISTSATNIDSNTTQAEQYYNGDRPSWRVITDLANRGSAANNRWVAGVFENRQLVYKQAETIDTRWNLDSDNKYLSYHKNPTDPGDNIFDEAGRIIEPWDARPDRLFFTVGYGQQPQYIEQVIFTTPYQLQTKSSDINPLREAVLV
jgi:hypothetical protein